MVRMNKGLVLPVLTILVFLEGFVKTYTSRLLRLLPRVDYVGGFRYNDHCEAGDPYSGNQTSITLKGKRVIRMGTMWLIDCLVAGSLT